MRLLIEVLPLRNVANFLQNNPAYAHVAINAEPTCFSLPVKPEETFAQVWQRIDERYKRNYLTPQQASTFMIKKLQDIYDCDLDLDDTVGTTFEGETDQKNLRIRVTQAPIDREVSIPVTSNLRPSFVHKRPRGEDQVRENKRRRIETQAYGAPIEELHPDRPVQSREPPPKFRNAEAGAAENGNDAGHVDITGSEDQLVPIIVRDSLENGPGLEEAPPRETTKTESPGRETSDLHDIPESRPLSIVTPPTRQSNGPTVFAKPSIPTSVTKGAERNNGTPSVSQGTARNIKPASGSKIIRRNIGPVTISKEGERRRLETPVTAERAIELLKQRRVSKSGSTPGNSISSPILQKPKNDVPKGRPTTETAPRDNNSTPISHKANDDVQKHRPRTKEPRAHLSSQIASSSPVSSFSHHNEKFNSEDVRIIAEGRARGYTFAEIRKHHFPDKSVDSVKARFYRYQKETKKTGSSKRPLDTTAGTRLSKQIALLESPKEAGVETKLSKQKAVMENWMSKGSDSQSSQETSETSVVERRESSPEVVILPRSSIPSSSARVDSSPSRKLPPKVNGEGGKRVSHGAHAFIKPNDPRKGTPKIAPQGTPKVAPNSHTRKVTSPDAAATPKALTSNVPALGIVSTDLATPWFSGLKVSAKGTHKSSPKPEAPNAAEKDSVSEVAPSVTPRATSKAVPETSPKAAPEIAQDASSQISQEVTAKVTPEVKPKAITTKGIKVVASKSTPERAPKRARKITTNLSPEVTREVMSTTDTTSSVGVSSHTKATSNTDADATLQADAALYSAPWSRHNAITDADAPSCDNSSADSAAILNAQLTHATTQSANNRTDHDASSVHEDAIIEDEYISNYDGTATTAVGQTANDPMDIDSESERDSSSGDEAESKEATSPDQETAFEGDPSVQQHVPSNRDLSFADDTTINDAMAVANYVMNGTQSDEEDLASNSAPSTSKDASSKRDPSIDHNTVFVDAMSVDGETPNSALSDASDAVSDDDASIASDASSSSAAASIIDEQAEEAASKISNSDESEEPESDDGSSSNDSDDNNPAADSPNASDSEESTAAAHFTTATTAAPNILPSSPPLPPARSQPKSPIPPSTTRSQTNASANNSNPWTQVKQALHTQIAAQRKREADQRRQRQPVRKTGEMSLEERLSVMFPSEEESTEDEGSEGGDS